MLALGSGLCGCATCGGGCDVKESRASGLRPAPVSHFVFVTLDDSLAGEARAQARRALIADSDAMLATIPVVLAYAAGEHLETGRTLVESSYDVAMYIGFADAWAYGDYVEHTQHQAFVAKWMPRVARLEVRDMLDPTE